MIQNRRTRRRRGALTVEFALCLPILLLMFFAAFEFCRANMLRHTADNAAYEGARRAIVPGATAQNAHDFAANMLATVGANGASIVVDPEVIEDNTEEVTVTVTVPLNENGFVAPFFLKDRDVGSSMTMVREKYEQTSVP